jgi:hypothetical protein
VNKLVLNSKITDLAGRLKVQFLETLGSSDDISLFLCGGSQYKQAEFRRILGKGIAGVKSKYMYSVYYPEDMFVELIHGHQRQDLLNLENMLAESVHCVIILLQSPGTFTELGAFANHESLRDKLIVVIDPEHRRKQSFISHGPIRSLLARTKSKVLYSRMDSTNLDVLVKQLTEAAREIARHSSRTRDLSNPVLSYGFYMALIYVFDPIPRYIVFDILRVIQSDRQDIAVAAAETVLNRLISERKVVCNNENLSITAKGIDSLIYDSRTKKRSMTILSLLSGLRLEALNVTLRKGYNGEWAMQGRPRRVYQ